MAEVASDPGDTRSGTSSDAETPLAEYQHPVFKAIKDHVFHEPHGQEDWQNMPELPTPAEILVSQDEAEPLPANCIDSAWPSKNDYLETHYRLLRREGTEALRYAVNKYKSNTAASDDEDMCIYTNVRILGYLMSRQGPLCRISFRTDHAQKKILWQQSRRLLPGSVVAVSTKRDNFKTICMTATVAQRPFRGGLDQNPPQVDLVWGNLSDYVVDPDMELIMVEARSGYFEAVRHTLVGLQMAADYDSPLFKYPVYGDKSDPPAKFIIENPKVDLSPCLSPTAPREKVEWMRAWDVRDDTPPDIRDYTTMDETQIHALCRMVSRELSIVQGPPGTGKTFTSVEALKVILANQGSGSPPIIVAAQTNHALDQILTLCLDAGARIARVGGRTESERIEEYTMFNLRKKFGSNPELLFKGLDSKRRKACNALKDLTATIFTDGLLRPEDLLNTGVITQEQYKSLVDEEMEQTKRHLEHGPFSLWMSGECIETEVLRNKYCDKNLVGDDAEFDREEYEIEGDLDNIAEDDEEDRIYGVFVPFLYKWTGKEPAHLTSWHKRAAKELKRTDLYSIPKNMRGAVYQLLFERFIEKLKPEFMKCFAEYIQCCKEVKAVRWLRDSGVVRQCHINVVGCTTTGLTKYRGFLAGLGARTMLIEEAAETRESNITSALYPSLQQLILVGDHLQLAPFCNTRWLGEKPYHLDMSMFQRMIDHLLIPYVMLDEQRRMAPEIRAVMDSFYGGLKDHEVARTREPVPGMGDRRTWLFAHNSEDTADANHSRYNTEEAAMVVNFFAYLINNGIKQSQITVLTFYKAQRRHILKKLKSHPSLAVTPEAFQVHTVDSYQGEENDIVLLSLVRSPPPNGDFRVGFLDNQNRVIVAISRARRGFYVFGNIVNASNASRESQEIWVPIWKSFIRQQRYDAKRGLPLQCQPHGNTIWIKNSNGWADNTGGCDQRCTFVRECGHQCGLPCHVKPHDKIRCIQVCGKSLPCGHKCNIWCKDPCNCLCDQFQALKIQSENRQIRHQQEMHMDLEELLYAEAIGGRPPQVSSSRPEDMQTVLARQPPPAAVAAVAEPRAVLRLDAQNLHKVPQTRGKGNRKARVVNGSARPVTNNTARQANRRPGTTQHSSTQNVIHPPNNDARPVANHVHQHQSGAAAFRQFANQIATHDQAELQAHQASLAQTAGQAPIINDHFRPVQIDVDGRRESVQSTSPEKDGNNPARRRVELMKVIAAEPELEGALRVEAVAGTDTEIKQESDLVNLVNPDTDATRIKAWINTLEPLSEEMDTEAKTSPDWSVEAHKGSGDSRVDDRALIDCHVSEPTSVDFDHATDNKGKGTALDELLMLMGPSATQVGVTQVQRTALDLATLIDDAGAMPQAVVDDHAAVDDHAVATQAQGSSLVNLVDQPGANLSVVVQKQAVNTEEQSSSLDLGNLVDLPINGAVPSGQIQASNTQARASSADLATLIDVGEPSDSSCPVVPEQGVDHQAQTYADLDSWLGSLSVNGHAKEQSNGQPGASAAHAIASAPKNHVKEADDLLIAL